MWIPTPVYERIPHFYFLAGLLFMTDGLYLGFENAFSFYYIGFGVLSCAYGVGIRVMRIKYRQARPTTESMAPAADEAAVDAPRLAEEPATSSDAMAGEPMNRHSVAH